MPVAAQAQGSNDDRAAVWATVERIWTAEESGDPNWVDSMLSEDFMGWPASSPAPRSKASTSMWARPDAAQQNGLAHGLCPLSIVAPGDTAVVHHLYTVAAQTRDKKTVTSNGRYTDVPVRDCGDDRDGP